MPMLRRHAVAAALAALVLTGCKGSNMGENTSPLAAAMQAVGAVVNSINTDKYAPTNGKLLGTKTLNFAATRDTITPANTPGPFDKMQFNVASNGPVELYNIRVTFEDGSLFAPLRRRRFSADLPSFVLELPGNQHHVRKVEFAYRAINPNSTPGPEAVVFAYGVP